MNLYDVLKKLNPFDTLKKQGFNAVKAARWARSRQLDYMAIVAGLIEAYDLEMSPARLAVFDADCHDNATLVKEYPFPALEKFFGTAAGKLLLKPKVPGVAAQAGQAMQAEQALLAERAAKADRAQKVIRGIPTPVVVMKAGKKAKTKAKVKSTKVLSKAKMQKKAPRKAGAKKRGVKKSERARK